MMPSSIFISLINYYLPQIVPNNNIIRSSTLDRKYILKMHFFPKLTHFVNSTNRPKIIENAISYKI